MKEITIYADGACCVNPGPGAAAALLIYETKTLGQKTKEIVEVDPATTNNRMEILAAIIGLEALKETCQVILHTDSKYVVDAFNKSWIKNWKSNGWQTAAKQAVKNQDLWERLDNIVSKHKVKFVHVPGHAGIDQNEIVNTLAQTAAQKLKEQLKVGSLKPVDQKGD